MLCGLLELLGRWECATLFFRALWRCLLNFGFSILAFSEVFFISQPRSFMPTLLYLSHRICAKCFSDLPMVYCQIKWAFCTFHALRSFFPENSFYLLNWVCLTTVCGNLFRRRRPYMGYISASLCFRVPFLVLYKLYIISCLIRVTSPQHRLWFSWIN